MSNQFDSDLIYRRTESIALHERTGAVCLVRDEYVRRKPGVTPELGWYWRVVAGKVHLDGWSRTEGLARAAIRRRLARGAVRRRVAKLPDRPRAVTVGDRSDAPVCGEPDRAGLVCAHDGAEEGARG